MHGSIFKYEEFVSSLLLNAFISPNILILVMHTFLKVFLSENWDLEFKI